ncbi:uncharacterized protein LOC133035859 [Cannabis sativa]|uniref:uncharacterized protein LOC133035859 n=1 Tax=Cannabis sativa TaxID=3483 RepID=UPI0029C9BE46|nr:uncharacterized protein LOC133035859 [Cannabis sativa]
MLAHYMNWLVPEVSEQLASADYESSLELLMGGVLKEFIRAGLKLAYTYSRAKSVASKNAALSNTMKAEVDLARKDADDARVELGVVRIELGEVNKKLFIAEKKVAELAKDLEASDQLEATIGSLSAQVNSLQEERGVLRTVFHQQDEEKKTKEEDLTTEIEKYKSEVTRQEEKVHALEAAGLEIFYDF